MESLKIILLCILAAVVYGILHDQVTARVCVEYFTIGHPPIFHTDSPTLLAFGWGVIATWWMGLILSIPAVLASRSGTRPKLKAADLVRPIACLLIVMARLAAGRDHRVFLAKAGGVRLFEPACLTSSTSKARCLPGRSVGAFGRLWGRLFRGTGSAAGCGSATAAGR